MATTRATMSEFVKQVQEMARSRWNTRSTILTHIPLNVYPMYVGKITDEVETVAVALAYVVQQRRVYFTVCLWIDETAETVNVLTYDPHNLYQGVDSD